MPSSPPSSRYASPHSPSVIASIVAAVVAVVSSIAFSIYYVRALRGFARQIEAFVSLGEWRVWLLQAALALFTCVLVVYLVVVHLASLHLFSSRVNRLGVSCMLFLSSAGSQMLLLLWVLVLCGVCSVGLLYFIFIGGIYSFCALVDTQCFDFKMLLCSAENNMVWNFGITFALGFISCVGLLWVQNAVVYSFGKRQGSSPIRKAIPGKNGNKSQQYEMTDIGSS
ncbi:hypothetical protein PRIPAC_72157 [Pristionchus pacificus]|uniref:Uncharacterized protein n=1 Tax=Pristionchus pacificus TaxID=54126 RepID=A0A2A6C6Y5_PRIPA|nr:hypothetical protein PRIPAC_72157 [Pristionchus pacificus]|eukprot:PDM73877.1 hypothetical protein PRIPAC_41233 [Pristionchus pacificus]